MCVCVCLCVCPRKKSAYSQINSKNQSALIIFDYLINFGVGGQVEGWWSVVGSGGGLGGVWGSLGRGQWGGRITGYLYA